MDYSKLSDQEVNGLIMDRISQDGQSWRTGEGNAIALTREIHTVEFGEHVQYEEVYAMFDPCNNAADAWPIIQRSRISLIWVRTEIPNRWDAGGPCHMKWATHEVNPLRAAMICYLMMQESE